VIGRSDRVDTLSRSANNSVRRTLVRSSFLYLRCGTRHADTKTKENEYENTDGANFT